MPVLFAAFPRALPTPGICLRAGELNFFVVLLIIILMVAVIGAIVFVEAGQRRIPVSDAKRIVGRKMYGGQTTHLPLKVKTAGVIPPIFASSVIMFPATIANFAPQGWMKDSPAPYLSRVGSEELLYVAFIFFFCFFYTAVTFQAR